MSEVLSPHVPVEQHMSTHYEQKLLGVFLARLKLATLIKQSALSVNPGNPDRLILFVSEALISSARTAAEIPIFFIEYSL